ncbi:hypothetical protein BVRB_7g161300 [Beta vulgaris subsp. vulgaris]|nr:hypothetical protein BVRB_7g161300 [Beta vulgaris subsp. vulgaris]
MFKFWGSHDQESQSRPQEAPPQSWYPPFVNNSPSYSRPSSAGSNASNSYNLQRPFERPQSPSHVSPAEAAGIISSLKDKSVDELRKLLTDKESYNQFLLALDQVKAQNNVRDELQKEMLELSRSNMDKEPQMVELRNQCRIIRTTELAAAMERQTDLEKKKDDLLKCYSSVSLMHRLEEEMRKTDKESDDLHSQFLDREIEPGAFLQKYKKLRALYHRRAMTHLAAKTSPMP